MNGENATSRRKPAFFRKALLPVWTGLNVLVASVTVFTALSGCIDPEKMPFAGLAGMTFAGWWLLNLLLLVVDLFSIRTLAVFPMLAILFSLKPFWAFCPLNIRHEKISEVDSAKVFTLLSYNVLSFHDNQPEMQTEGFNRTMHTLLSSGADIISIAELNNQGPLTTFVPQSQIDSLNALYPYSAIGKHGNALYSKTPVMYIELPSQDYATGSHEVYRTIIDGRGTMIFGVHMVSFGLNDSDKGLYRELTDMQTDSVNVGEVRSKLIDKLYGAFRERAVQAMMIREYIDQLPDENVIVCGDFNDVPLCRPIRILEETGLKDVYSEVGFGPMITYNDSRLFFRIDHVLYRGDFRPLSIRRGNVASSDHYPLFTTFCWN